MSPVLGEKRIREHHHSECAPRDAFVDFAAKTLSYPELEFVVLHTQPALPQFTCKRSDDLILILAGMRDEDVPVLRDEKILGVIDSGHGLGELLQRWNNALTEFRQASREDPNTRPAAAGQATVIDNYIPVPTARDLQADW